MQIFEAWILSILLQLYLLDRKLELGGIFNKEHANI